MMATTHALVGAALAAGVAVIAPELAPIALAAGVAGGAFPDLDLYQYHRRTLHFPTYYSIAAMIAVSVAFVVSTPVTVGVAVFFIAAAIHSRMDRYGGGLELRPWEGTSDRAVYDHSRHRWRRPLRWVRYDGAPEDLGVAVIAAIPVFVIYEDPIRWGVVAVIGVSVLYMAVRKQLPAIAVILAKYVPSPLRGHVPRRYLP